MASEDTSSMELILASSMATIAAKTTLDLEGIVLSMQASGMSKAEIRAVLLADLNEGGRIFGGYRNAIKNTVKDGVGMSSNLGSRGTFEGAGVQEFQWVTVGDGKVCPDCDPRHGEEGTLEFFRTIGLPQSGFSVCQQSCRCQILPASFTSENLDVPLVREKKN